MVNIVNRDGYHSNFNGITTLTDTAYRSGIMSLLLVLLFTYLREKTQQFKNRMNILLYFLVLCISILKY